jgi:hypothetical protein
MTASDFDNKHQRNRVFDVMQFGKWHTLYQIRLEIFECFKVKDSEAAISARLRDFRKEGRTVERRRVSQTTGRLYEYRLVIPQPAKRQQELTFEKEVGNTRSY